MTSHKHVEVDGSQLFYLETGELNTKGDVLLLHGMRFSSQTWWDLKTMEKLAQWGYHAVAVDLPEYGKSKDSKAPTSTAHYLLSAIQALKLKKPTVISPSMSGMYSLPFLHQFGNEHLTGYIPIAPITTEQYTKEQYENITVPTYIVYGSNDERLGDPSYQNLKQIPRSEQKLMIDAGHACYLDQPEVWHNMLENIVKDLTS